MSAAQRIKIATFNVNGIASRLPALLDWLAKSAPDIACLQELKAPDADFPILAVRAAGYGAVWHGQRSWNGVAILARGADPTEIRRGLPGDPDDTHSRYLEAASNGIVVGCLYLPNGNPQPGLQAGVVRAPDPARQTAGGLRSSGRTGGRLQRGRDRLRHLRPEVMEEGRPVATRDARGVRAVAGAGMD